jgi:hypothetical protein
MLNPDPQRCSKQKASSTINQLLSFKGLKLGFFLEGKNLISCMMPLVILNFFKEAKAVVFENLP